MTKEVVDLQFMGKIYLQIDEASSHPSMHSFMAINLGFLLKQMVLLMTFLRLRIFNQFTQQKKVTKISISEESMFFGQVNISMIIELQNLMPQNNQKLQCFPFFLFFTLGILKRTHFQSHLHHLRSGFKAYNHSCSEQ